MVTSLASRKLWKFCLSMVMFLILHLAVGTLLAFDLSFFQSHQPNSALLVCSLSSSVTFVQRLQFERFHFPLTFWFILSILWL